MQRHNGIINKYKLKFQKSLSLHLYHLSQVRVRCPSSVHAVHVWPARGAHAVHVWLARGARLARLRCAFGLPAVSSLSPWNLNHQTSRLSLLST